MTDVRTLVLAIPHWSTIAAGAAYDCPAAVMHMNRVVDATPFAVEQGVVPGIRRREAQRPVSYTHLTLPTNREV